MTPQELRNSIINKAIQGKLVKQSVFDVPIEIDLYAGDISELFEIPPTWKWTALKCVVTVNTGLSFKKEDQLDSMKGDLRVLRGGNIGDSYNYFLLEDDIFVNKKKFSTKYLPLKKGDVITPAVTSIEKICKVGIIDNDYSDITAGGFVYIIRVLDSKKLNCKFLQYFISSSFNKEQCKPNIHKSGQAFYNLKKSSFIEQPICVPPLEEQERIVAKIEELLPLVDKYEEAWNKLEKLNKEFPISLEKSILQYAIQGKLVEQRNDEGTGEELFAMIQKQKQELLKNHLIKKEKNLNQLMEDEIPFKIPSSWKWCRIASLVDIINGFTPLRGEEKFWKNGTINWMTVEDLNKQGKYLNFTEQHITTDAIKSNDRIVPPNSTFICCTSATIGRVAINNVPMTSNQQFNGLKVKAEVGTSLLNDFLYYYCCTLKSKLIEIAGITTFPFVSVEKLGNLPFPLPPLEEQKRIVAKIEELLPLCKMLNK